MKDIIEALLIATDEPLSLEKLSGIVNSSVEEVKRYLEILNQEYKESGRAFEIKEVASGYQIYTLPQYAEFIGKLKQKKEKLSRAALETLAIIAYHQPITRAEIEKLRGVDSSYILESLLGKGLIKTCGRLSTPGRPIRYGTTNEFLRYFGIRDLSELPSEEDFSAPSATTVQNQKPIPIKTTEDKEKETFEEEFEDLTD